MQPYTDVDSKVGFTSEFSAITSVVLGISKAQYRQLFSHIWPSAQPSNRNRVRQSGMVTHQMILLFTKHSIVRRKRNIRWIMQWETDVEPALTKEKNARLWVVTKAGYGSHMKFSAIASHHWQPYTFLFIFNQVKAHWDWNLIHKGEMAERAAAHHYT